MAFKMLPCCHPEIVKRPSNQTPLLESQLGHSEEGPAAALAVRRAIGLVESQS